MLERLRERFARRGGVVADTLDGHDVRARLRAARRNEDAVRLVDLPVQQRLPGCDELVARDHDANAGSTVTAHFGDADVATAASASGPRRLPRR